jgi:hypothetical protein
VTTTTIGTGLDGMRTYLKLLADMSWQHMTKRAKSYELNYSGSHDYVLDRGQLCDSTRLLTVRERHLLRRAAEKAGAMWSCTFEVKECFYNAQALAMSDETETIRYHEGFALGHFFPVHHAWVTINGKVVDLTWRNVRLADDADAYEALADPLDHRILGRAPEAFVYFGCDGFEPDEMHDRIVESGVCWSFLDGDAGNGELVERYQQPRLTPREPAVVFPDV